MRLSQMVERVKGEAIIENDVDDVATKQAEESKAAAYQAEINNLKALAGI